MTTNKCKVIQVITDKNIGGAGRWLLSYLKYYDRERLSVSVALPKGSLLVPMVRALEAPLFEMEGMEERSLDFGIVKAFRKLFSEEKPDIVHTHASLSARIAAKQAGVPAVVHSKHYIDPYIKNPLKRRGKVLLDQCLSSRTVAVSNAVQESLLQNGYPKQRIVTIYNGVDFSEPFSDEEKKKIRTEFGLPEGMRLFGMVARLAPIKDHETFLLAAAAVLKKIPDTLCLVVGDGPLAGTLHKQVETLGISDRVVFTGFVEQVERISGILDVNVITSRQEALCISILEGMSLGVPAVGTASGGVQEVIADGVNGFLAPVGDAAAIAKGITRLLSDPASREAYGKNARKTVSERFLAKDLAGRMDTLFLRLAAGEK